MKTSDKIIERIKKENIEPTPKWFFLTKNLLVWLAFVLSIFIGAAAFSIILFTIQQTDFDLISHMAHSRIEWALAMLPFFWIIALVIFLIIAIVSIYHSKRGYKLAWSKLVVGNVLLSVLIGTLFFIAGGAGKLEKAFAIRVSLYESLQEKKTKIWMTPQEGLLAGHIQNVQDSSFQLVDFNNKTWQVDFKGAFVAPVIAFSEEEKVKLIGETQEDSHFKAFEVRPWGGPKRRNKRIQ